MDSTDAPQPRCVETGVELLCAACGTALYRETVTEERNDAGVLVETGRSVSVDERPPGEPVPVCPNCGPKEAPCPS